MAMRWHSLPTDFTTENKTISTYITRRKEKKTEGENGLEFERVHARHLDLCLMS